jgi:hypothetical protein
MGLLTLLVPGSVLKARGEGLGVTGGAMSFLAAGVLVLA